MVKADNPRSSALVAPLSIHKVEGRAQDFSAPARHKSNNSSKSSTAASSTPSQMTPPATPDGSQEEDLMQQAERPPIFHNFLRAFYPFHPTYAVSDTTVTLPLNEGDVVLVHSIHTNGWADGTLLISGARGWLPTNYCEAYDPESLRTLLQALLNFWDLMRSGHRSDAELFGNQEFMRGIIAGVRYLLEKSHCLTRESPLVQSNDGLRRNRKALLSELSALVKAAKRLQEFIVTPTSADDVNDVIDEMILKAFKIVTKGVRFLDILEDDRRKRQPLVNRVMETVVEESSVPPTPPADSTSFEGRQHGDNLSDAASRRTSSHSTASGMSTSTRAAEQPNTPSRQRSPGSHSSATTPERRMSRSGSVVAKRPSVSHRLSMTIPAAQRHNLISERLNVGHDNLLSHLGSFIGRLHLQSQSTADLVVTIRHTVTAGKALLAVVEAVCARDTQSADTLDQARSAMYDRINKLVVAARDVIKSSGLEEDDVVMPQENGRLLMAATGCVKAAGECVAKCKFVLDRIGDFEFEGGLSFDVDPAPYQANHISPGPNGTSVPGAKALAPLDPGNRAPPPPLIIPLYEKPLPEVPVGGSPGEKDVMPRPQPPLESVAEGDDTDETNSSRSSFLPPLPKLHSPLMTHDDYSPTDRTSPQDGEYQASLRSGSIAVSSIGTTSSYLSSVRGSESSMLSQTSTRATTPDVSNHAPKNTRGSLSDSSLSGSHSTIADDLDDGESRMLEKTFAHQLMYNKDGQITGGTLPALVERLTTHDSTPDAMFVSTFYLTFRLFASPIELATALVERFDYVAESPHIAAPVRLRVYNVFKGWLESHWKRLVDLEALSIIESFAKVKLLAVLPHAGRRLLELAGKVSSTDGPLVPRLVSSMGKTNTSMSQYIPADTPLPTPNLSKAQTAALKNWKMGGSSPDITVFDPLELARQLTIKETNIFCAIMPDELLGSEWTKRSGSNAVNVRAMSTLSTDLSNLVADTILHHDDFKKRAVTIKHWIKISQKCLELNNYDSLMAIICTLNSSTIVRLKATWAAVSPRRKDMLKGLQAIVEPDKNYAVLRRRLHDHVPPCLPFVGTYLTDLTFVDAGNPATKQLPGHGDSEGIQVINFDKHTRTAKIIGELQRFQIPYRLTEIPELQEWMQAQIVRVKSSPNQEQVQQFYRKSLLLEPRANFPRPSPIDHTSFGSAGSTGSVSSTGHKEKFDLFGWTHSRERQLSAS
ncbi:ras guanine-nucleotide exchange protein-like protein [Coleophoma crateriformis]|uniref:Ras guanine-nucleotide exchange protein-like protein n=1 Tax=Coleophoma crateriformis TaxID=565419 RepID=A0A3D8SZ13_9HELO|nr:ras guanine-nucleotide exchange protein-like protein [Coleophoma crateriformis]